MSPNIYPTQKKKNRAGFGRQGAVFKITKPNGSVATKCTLRGRARQAFELLLQAEDRGLTQRVTLALDPTFWRLAAAICELRDRGFLIRTHRQYRSDGKWCARYVLNGHCVNSMREVPSHD